MNVIKATFVLFIAINISGCGNSKNNKSMVEKIEIANILQEASTWYTSTRREFAGEISISNLSKDEFNWSEKIMNSISNSNFFSVSFITNRVNIKKEKFGQIFYTSDDEIGALLYCLCHKDNEIVVKELEEINDSTYRYCTSFKFVLGSIPYEYVDWLTDIDDANQRWLYSIVIIKENNKWVIDKIEKHWKVWKWDMYPSFPY